MTLLQSYLMPLVLTAVTRLTSSAVSCPNGDTAGEIKNGQTCSELVTTRNAECYDTSFETTCCTSCNAVATSNSNCLYGDSATCFEFLCSSYSDINSCCDTCASLITTATTTTTSTSTTSTSTKSTTSTTSTSMSTAISSATQTSEETTPLISTTMSNNNETSDEGSNGGIIAGAVIGSIVGVTVLAVGAFIAVKILKKKDNKVDDETSSSTSSGLPEKLDRYPVTIPEQPDICTVLQEKLETSPNLSDKLDDSLATTPIVSDVPTKTKPHKQSVETPAECYNNKVNVDETQSDGNANLKEESEPLPDAAEKSDANPKLQENISTNINGVVMGDNVFKRRFSLPPLNEAHPGISTKRERLPPIAGVGENFVNTVTEEEDENEDKRTTSKLSSIESEEETMTEAEGDKHINTSNENNAVRFKQSNFIFPSFM